MLPKLIILLTLLGLSFGVPNRTACNVDDKQPPNRRNTTEALQELRLQLTAANLDALLVTLEDEHQNHVVGPSSRRIKFISGFTGSFGTVIITKTKAVLWTDGRYHIQADSELDCNWTLMRSGLTNVPELEDWLYLEFPNGAKIGADPKRNPAMNWHEIENSLQAKSKNYNLVKTEGNLIDLVWQNKPQDAEKQAYILSEEFSGKNWYEKVKEVRLALNKAGADAMIVTTLDEVAWLLNIRGNDIPFTTLVKAYVFISNSEITLFLDKHKLPHNYTEVFEQEGQEKLRNLEYKAIWNELPNYVKSFNKILVPSGFRYNLGASKEVYDIIPNEKRLYVISPIMYLKSVKNQAEIIGMENAHLKEAASTCEFLEYLEEHQYDLDEYNVAQLMDQFRAKDSTYFKPSFKTISAFGPNSAKPHYIPTIESSIKLTNGSVIMIDSGGQYLGGTTDLTRTISIGNPDPEQIEAYTRVLMGMIDLSCLVFPSSLNASQMDTIARTRIWELGYDYLHGTGHGVGSFLLIHEGPISIFYKLQNSEPLKPGYFTSIEPGIYLEGKFGIRLENVVQVVTKSDLKYNFGDTYLTFKTIALVPYDIKLINLNLLEKKHITWLKEYYTEMLTKVGKELKKQKKEHTYRWLNDHAQYVLKELGQREEKYNS